MRAHPMPGRANNAHNRTTRSAICGLLAALLIISGTVSCLAESANIEQRFAPSLTNLPTEPLVVSGGVYVPAYSSVSISQGNARADFSVTLSIHNASETRALVVRRIGYFDTAGKMVDSYLKAPVALKPFATIEVASAAKDVRGCTGANFVVDWAATGEIAEPVIEALMLGGLGSGHYAFISQARPIKVVGKN